MPTTAHLHVHISPHRLQIIQEITQMQFSLREHVLLICPTQLQPRHPRTDLKPTKQCWGKQLQLTYFFWSKEWVMRWNETGSMARERQNAKRPLLPEELVTSKPPFTAAFYTLPTYCSALQRSCQKERGKRFREDSKEESSPVPAARPCDRNAKSKTRPSGNFCNKLVYTASPLLTLLLASTAWPQSAICLIATALQHLRQAGTAFTRRCLFEL